MHFEKILDSESIKLVVHLFPAFTIHFVTSILLSDHVLKVTHYVYTSSLFI